MGIENADTMIRINDVEIAYIEKGTGEHVLIFLHGFPFDKSTWTNQLSVLPKGVRGIAYDHRGFGKSTAGNKPFSMDLFADDLLALMDALNIKKATLCGLSMGGYILLNAVSRFPERFNALMLCDTQCNADTAEGVNKRMATIESIRKNGLDTYADESVKNMFSNFSKETHPDIIEQVHSLITSTQQESIIATLKALAQRRETCSRLSEIDVPVLIICGNEDKITPPEKSEALQKSIKGSTMHIIDRSGHLTNIEQPSEFNSLMLSFIESIKN